MIETNTMSDIMSSHGFFNLLSGYKKVQFNRTERKFSLYEEGFVGAKWDELLISGKVKFSSKLVGIMPEMTKVEDEVLHLTGYKTEYKHYRTTLEGDQPIVWITGPSGVLSIKHGKEDLYLIGERKNNTTQIGGMLEFIPGGYLEASHFDDPDPFVSTFYQELMEETGIDKRYVAKINQFWTGQLRNHPQSNKLSRDVCLDFLVDVEEISPNQIIEGFRALNSKEHVNLHFVPKSELTKYAEVNWQRFNLRGRCSLMHLLKK